MRHRLCYTSQSDFSQLIPHNKLWGSTNVYKENDITYFSIFSNSDKSDDEWVLNEESKKDLFERIDKIFELYIKEHPNDNTLMVSFYETNDVFDYIKNLAISKYNFEYFDYFRSSKAEDLYSKINWDGSFCVDKFGKNVVDDVLEPLFGEMDENTPYGELGPTDIRMIDDLELRHAFVQDMERSKIHPNVYGKNVLLVDDSVVFGGNVDWVKEIIDREYILGSLNVITMCPGTDINIFES